MKGRTSVILVALSFFLLTGTINAQQSDTPKAKDDSQQPEDQGDQPVDSTGKAHYQQGSLGYMAGQEHYIQGNLGYMAGKEHYSVESKEKPMLVESLQAEQKEKVADQRTEAPGPSIQIQVAPAQESRPKFPHKKGI